MSFLLNGNTTPSMLEHISCIKSFLEKDNYIHISNYAIRIVAMTEILSNVILFTVDSAIKLPSISKSKGTTGKGSKISDNRPLMDVLHKTNLNLPSNNIEDEKKYRLALREFIRPARIMYAGSFSEVRIFSEELSELLPTDLFIISGRYGIINQHDRIIPYHTEFKNSLDIKDLDKETSFSKLMLKIIENKRYVILLLPSLFIKYLQSTGWFMKLRKEQKLFIISGNKNGSNFITNSDSIFLPRKGVARIGESNRKIIIHNIKLDMNIFDF